MPVEDKTITIVFGTDYANLQIVNFVAMTEYPLEVARVSFYVKVFHLSYFFFIALFS